MKKHNGQKFFRILVVMLVMLLAVSGTALTNAFTVQAAANTVVVDEAKGKKVTLQIYRNHAEDSTPFNCPNMLPGDSETGSYYLKVSHKGSITVHFHADIRDGYEKLAEVLKCKITLRDGTELYDGLMRDMPESINHELSQSGRKTSEIIYDITVYLDTSIGNEYMSKELYADFRWWVEEDAGDDSGELVPKLGDDSLSLIFLWIAMISLLVIIILLVTRLRRKNSEQGERNNER